MRTLRLSLAGAAVLVLAIGAGGSVVAQDPVAGMDDPGSVLILGNSLTYYNGGVEKQVAALAAAEDPARETMVDEWTWPDADLQYLYEYTRGAALDAIREGDHDAVVVQGYMPTHEDPEAVLFLEYARLFDQEITDAGAETVLYMTWPIGVFNPVDLDDIVRAHRRIEAETGASVAPVGVAMEKALAERPDLEMISFDALHPTPAGTYLAAATIYATLFDRSPEGLDFTAIAVEPEDAAFLQRIAWETVQEWQAGSAG
jgi:hypothetical protein